MMSKEELINVALCSGFTFCGALNTAALESKQFVRDSCVSDRCGAYGKNWTCPPACGTLDECGQRIRKYNNGLLLQTVGQLSKAIDSRAYRDTEHRHNESLRIFAEVLRKEYPDALVLGAGGCRICENCAYPEPCRFPEKSISSMEAYGLFVTQVCRDSGMEYSHGERTITYSACVLY